VSSVSKKNKLERVVLSVDSSCKVELYSFIMISIGEIKSVELSSTLYLVNVKLSNELLSYGNFAPITTSPALKTSLHAL
jgi:hypothetical protein